MGEAEIGEALSQKTPLVKGAKPKGKVLLGRSRLEENQEAAKSLYPIGRLRGTKSLLQTFPPLLRKERGNKGVRLINNRAVIANTLDTKSYFRTRHSL